MNVLAYTYNYRSKFETAKTFIVTYSSIRNIDFVSPPSKNKYKLLQHVYSIERLTELFAKRIRFVLYFQ